MSTANRVIKNTGYLYAKMGVTVFISLYTTRLILNALGVSDFGVYNVVGGAISMLGFLHAAMSTTTQRFMSFYEGRGDKEMQKYIFNVSNVLHYGIAFVLVILLLLAGVVFFNGVLNIPEDRIFAAKVIYGSLILSTVFTVVSVPYEAVLNAHENMLYYSIVGIIESLLKLAVAVMIVYYVGDKLVLYGILMVLVPFISRVIMQVYCRRKYEECVIAPRTYFEKSLMKEMTSFAGWSFLVTSSGMVTQYGMGLVLNNFFGAVLNAAQGVANQISGQLMVFSNNMFKAVNPVIVKSEGGGNRTKMLEISMVSAKFSIYMLAFFAIPFIIETEYLLKLWLKNIPDFAIIFVRLQLLRFVIEQFTFSIGKVIEAEGRIKKYSVITSVLNIFPIILTYVFFEMGYPPYFLYISWILMWGIVRGAVILWFSKFNCGMSYRAYFNKVLLPGITICLAMILFGYLPLYCMDSSLVRLFLVGVTTSLTFIVMISLVFVTPSEKEIFTKLLRKISFFRKT
ncbi:Na+-driven multidrug efflux pump [Pustulibacterium marinum]|uniref:Na+-driven multidrug efflux pump n=1 Tax=Pustulibacterium marinum TaxID=1224947 RepID=A0A1I7F1S5_9FLAO|nr:hypothetical protein [Pustulibacterium marinum]SFU30116.1 Na+-driven multidrug efflux pump [Pustulibacterium marinum]